LVNNDLKKRIKFWNDENIPLKQVNESCERCSLTDCEVRAAQPVIYKKRMETDTLEAELNAFISKMKELQES
jgi:DNA-binding transcriptional MerR regulator